MRKHVLVWLLVAAALVAGGALWWLSADGGSAAGTATAREAPQAPTAESLEPTLEGAAGRVRGREGKSGREDEPGAAGTPPVTPGVMVTHEGVPQAGATVCIRPSRDDLRAVRVQLTDAQGLAAFDGLEVDGVAVQVVKDGFRPQLRWYGSAHGLLEVSLETGVPFDGHVVDAGTGAPIAGAEVVLDDWGDRYHLGVTDAAGRFRVPGVKNEEECVLAAHAPGYAPAVAEVSVQDGKAPSDVVLRLGPGGTLVGTVRAAGGDPVAGARVRVVPERLTEEDDEVEPDEESYYLRLESLESAGDETTRGERWEARHHARETVTDREGAFRLDALAFDEPYLARATAEGHADSALTTGILFRGGTGERVLDLTLRRPSLVVVRVLPPRGTELPSAANVRVFQHLKPRKPEGRDEDGRFRFFVAPGVAHAFAQAPGFLSAKRRLDVPEGSTVHVDLELLAGASVEGTVVDREGRPLLSARVEVAPRDANEWTSPRYLLQGRAATTDADGRFTVSGLVAGDMFLIARWQELGTPERVELSAPTAGVKVVLAPLGNARIRLVLPSGAPFVGTVSEMLHHGTSGSGTELDVEDGVVEEDDLPDGEYRWVLRPTRFAWLERKFTIRGGAAIDLGDVVVDVGVRISGRVLDGSGRPIAGVAVGCGERQTTTDPDGRFVLEHLPREQRLGLWASKDGCLDANVEIEPAKSSTVDLRLLRAAIVTGVMRHASGKAVKEEYVMLRRPGAVGRPATYTDEEGKEVAYLEFDEQDWLSSVSGPIDTNVAPGRWVGWWQDPETQKEVRVGDWTFAEGERQEIVVLLPN